jgi:hypothetical protein
LRAPCEVCLKFPICKYREYIKCSALWEHTHVFINSEPGWNYTKIVLDNTIPNMEEIYDIERMFNKKIKHMNSVVKSITFESGESKWKK